MASGASSDGAPVYPRAPRPLRRYAARVELAGILRGAAAGAIGAAVWAAQQPLDRRVLQCSFSDVELLGKAVTRGRGWPLVGLAMHIQNGAAFGAAYAVLKPSLPGPPIARGALAGMVEHAASWPLVRLVDRYHPARRDLVTLTGNRRALVQATWRHLVFGAALGAVEDRLSRPRPTGRAAPMVDAAHNGHSRLEASAPATA